MSGSSGPAIERALALIGEDITLFEDERPLRPSSATGRLPLPSDRSFDGTPRRSPTLEARPTAGTGVYVDQGYVDAQLTYAIASARGKFSIRTTVFPDVAGFVETRGPLPSTGRGGAGDGDHQPSGTVSLNPTW